MDRVKRIWYLSPMRAAKVQASLRIRAVSPEPSLLAHRSSESRGTFRQKARSVDPLNGWACAVEICHDGMLEDTNSLDGAHIIIIFLSHLTGWWSLLVIGCLPSWKSHDLFVSFYMVWICLFSYSCNCIKFIILKTGCLHGYLKFWLVRALCNHFKFLWGYVDD